MLIYLYKKTHNITGLKYLGKTTQNPYKYHGSGDDWVKHIKEYGTDISTEVLLECNSNEELSYWGRYYSNLWNVSESSEWANKIPETGGGGLYGNLNPMKDDTIKAKISGENHYTKKEGYVEKRGGPTHHMKKEKYKKYGIENPMSNPEVKAKHAEQNKKAHNKSEVREKKSILAKNRWENDNFKKSTSLRMKESNTPEVRKKKSLSLIGKKQKINKCPHCGKTGGNNLKRYHFDKCKIVPKIII